MDTAKIFMSGRSQAVRLPKAYRMAGKSAYIKKVGNALVLIPENEPWDTLIHSLELFEPGFRIERDQPTVQQKRATLVL